MLSRSHLLTCTALWLTLLTGCHQHIGNPGQNIAGTLSPRTQMGNGAGYDGIIRVRYTNNAPAAVCADGTYPLILMDANTGEYSYKDCSGGGPTPIPRSEVESAVGSRLLGYGPVQNGGIFVRTDYLPPQDVVLALCSPLDPPPKISAFANSLTGLAPTDNIIIVQHNPAPGTAGAVTYTNTLYTEAVPRDAFGDMVDYLLGSPGLERESYSYPVDNVPLRYGNLDYRFASQKGSAVQSVLNFNRDLSMGFSYFTAGPYKEKIFYACRLN